MQKKIHTTTSMHHSSAHTNTQPSIEINIYAWPGQCTARQLLDTAQEEKILSWGGNALWEPVGRCNAQQLPDFHQHAL